MSKNTLLDVAERTLRKAEQPLTPTEIWKQAQPDKLNTLEGFTTEGKTPWASLGAHIGTDIRTNKDGSRFCIISANPYRYWLRELQSSVSERQLQTFLKTDESDKKNSGLSRWKERDLHPLLAAFAARSSHFAAKVKTIFHEKSKHSRKSENEWLHPDLVGVYFPFEDYKKEVQDILTISANPIKFFSFEMKKKLDWGTLRESFFQAVSNSSWANEGYLAALDIENESEFRDELRRLSNAFGIGIIRLNAVAIDESEILCLAKTNAVIDWDTVNRLAEANSDFCDFLQSIKEDCQLGRVKSEKEYDEVLSEECLTKYIAEKKIGQDS